MLRRPIRVDEGTWRATGSGFEAVWPLKVAGSAFELRTEVRGVTPPPAGLPVPEAALAAALLPAMRGRRAVRMGQLTSERLVSALPQLQETLHGFFPRLRTVRVQHEAVGEVLAPAARGAGVFLSLGIDSFYSLLIQRHSLTDLVLVQGFDIPLENEDLWAQAVASAKEVAAWTDMRLVLVRTNVRALLDEFVRWDVAHGAALAHVALTLTPWLAQVTIASSHHAEPHFPHGSHPALDPLWSTEWLTLLHHGSDARRIDTLAYLAREKVALDHLRVCRARVGGTPNCGQCPKCLLAMVGLEVVGGLEHCRTLPHAIPEGALLAVESWSRAHRIELEALRDAWQEVRPGSEVLEEIRATVTQALAAEE